MSTPNPPVERQRDADRSREAILQAALDAFSQLGLDGARMEDIASRAGINKRLIYYYFQDKDDLFQKVLERAYSHIRNAEQQLRLEDLSPAEAIRTLVKFTWNYCLDHPEFQSLLGSANLHKARHLKQSRARELNSPVIVTLKTVLARGEREGVFRSGIDPTQLYISIAALTFFYISNNHTLSAIFGHDLLAPDARQTRLKHMCDLVLGYVRRD